jgi:SAM-dependent methyltransferase
MHPMMKEREIRIIENAILGRKRTRLHILEWGCGGSTEHFPKFLSRHGIDYHWLSIEHDKDWFLSVSEDLKDEKNVDLFLVETLGGNPRDPACRMDEYVSFPATLERKFDMILVDGRKRRRCLLEAKRLLAPGGVVFLHDAHRRRYHCALAVYPDSLFLTRDLWRGSNEAPPLGTKWRNRALSVIRLRLGKLREK